VNTRTIRSGGKEARLRRGKPDLRDQYGKIGIAAVASAVRYQGDRRNPRSASHVSKRDGSKPR
jgi:hypothetical protein